MREGGLLDCSPAREVSKMMLDGDFNNSMTRVRFGCYFYSREFGGFFRTAEALDTGIIACKCCIISAKVGHLAASSKSGLRSWKGLLRVL